MTLLLQESAEVMHRMHPTHTIVVHGAATTCLVGDKDRPGQVFINLLSNAIKYSPFADTVEVDIHSSAEAITISVHDHGIGIPQEQREKIFERCYRAVDPSTKAFYLSSTQQVTWNSPTTEPPALFQNRIASGVGIRST